MLWMIIVGLKSRLSTNRYEETMRIWIWLIYSASPFEIMDCLNLGQKREKRLPHFIDLFSIYLILELKEDNMA